MGTVMPNQSFENIFEAAESGSVEDVKYFVEQQGADVNVTDLLFHVAEYTSVEVLQYRK